MKYEDQIFLNLIPPKNVTASVARPVIKVDQSSDVVISLNNPDPGTYPIKVQGIGADGKVRDAMTVIGVSSKIGTRLFTPSISSNEMDSGRADVDLPPQPQVMARVVKAPFPLGFS